MDLLKQKRKGLRASFTACGNKIQEELMKPEVDKNVISVLSAQLEDKFQRLEVSQQEVGNGILTSKDSERLYKEDFITAEEYRDRYIELSGKCRKVTMTTEVSRYIK